MKTRVRTPYDVRDKMKRFGLIALAIGVVFCLLGHEAGAIGTGVGVSQAFAGPIGVPVEGTVSDQVVQENVPGLNPASVSSIISKIRPDDVPLDTVLREIGSAEGVDGKSFVVKYYQSSTRSTILKTTAGFTSASGQGDITVDVIGNCAEHYVLRIPNITNTAGDPINLFVTKKDISSKKISVIAVNGDEVTPGVVNTDTTIPTIPANTVLYAIGIAKNELDAKTEAMEMLPTETTNYCQIFMCQVEEGIYQEMVKKDVNYGILDYKADAIYMMKMLGDLTTLYGRKALRYNPQTDKAHYFSGGAIENAGTVKTYSLGATPSAVINDEWINNLVKVSFSGVNGSTSRAWFLSPDLMERVQNVKFVQKQLEANKTETKFGVEFTVIKTAFGTIYLKVHNGLSIAGDPNGGFVLDLNNIRRRELQPAKWTTLNFDETGISKVKAARLEEAFCCEFRNIMTHVYIQAVA